MSDFKSSLKLLKNKREVRRLSTPSTSQSEGSVSRPGSSEQAATGSKEPIYMVKLEMEVEFGDHPPPAPDGTPAMRVPPEPMGLPCKTRTRTVLRWGCNDCGKECVPVRDESRCMCGHRLREHAKSEEERPFKCNRNGCRCKHFFYIVAEGSWILRCRCKDHLGQMRSPIF
ncbi:hypothetical protein CYMTET_49055 [Cymbomonas tetramitiformis]|uniref:Protein FAM221A n=1 Tax=Cymbomonas tetramitiformis TaxID=36881 RepID=A0AAE0BQX8_9CHLO|nr:hypothetical protein CYMTET_49055 [Cymbomonas tetramitiformis]